MDPDFALTFLSQNVHQPTSNVTVTWLLLPTTVSPSLHFVMEFLTAQALTQVMSPETFAIVSYRDRNTSKSLS